MARASAMALQQVLGRRLLGMGDWEKVASINAWYRAHDGLGTVTARIELEPGLSPESVLDALRDNLVSVENEGADGKGRAQVAQQARDSMLMSTYLSLESLSIGGLSEYLRATGKQDAIRGRQLQVLSLNQTIETYWHEHFKRSRSAAVVVLPDPEWPAPLSGGTGLAERMNDAHSEEGGTFTPRRPVEEVARPPGLDQAVRTRLPNGLTVVLVRRPLLPLAEARLVIPTDLAGQGGTSTLMPRFAMAFAGNRSDSRWMHSSRLGAQGYTAPDLESVSFMRRGSAATLQQLLEDLERLTHNFEFGRSRATWIRDSMSKALGAARRLPSGIASEAFDDALYPGHPYGHRDLPADAEALETGAAEAWVEQQLLPDQATLIVAGDIEPGGELLKRITSIFGGWRPGRAGPLLRTEPPLPKAPRLLLVDQPGSRLAELRVGLRAPPATVRDGAAGDAVARRLGQTLQETLRVAAGTTYGVHARFTELPLASTLFLETAVDASVAGEALVRLLAGVEGLAQVPLPEEAVAQVRWLLARDFSMQFDTTSQVTGALATSAAQGLPPDHWERHAASIVSLTSARIQGLARSLLGREVILVVGDARVVGPQLQDAGFDAELVTAAR